MKLKLNEDGSATVVDGKPVYVYDDGKEVPFDVDATIRRISNLTDEKERHYTNVTTLKDSLAKYEGIEDPDAAREALVTVANLKDKDLVDAKEVDTLKANLSKMFEDERNQLTTTFNSQKTELEQAVGERDGVIRELMIGGKFASSPWFSGEKPKTILPPDIAAEHFGRNFRVEGEGSDVRVVGYLNGDKILSRERVGEPAGFEEALSVVINSYSQKDRILRETAGGAGGSGNTGSGGKNTITRNQFDSKSQAERTAFVQEGGRVV